VIPPDNSSHYQRRPSRLLNSNERKTYSLWSERACVYFVRAALLSFLVAPNVTGLVANFLAVTVGKPRDPDAKPKHQDYQPMERTKFAHVNFHLARNMQPSSRPALSPAR
jgi:hypothetical protein